MCVDLFCFCAFFHSHLHCVEQKLKFKNVSLLLDRTPKSDPKPELPELQLCFFFGVLVTLLAPNEVTLVCSVIFLNVKIVFIRNGNVYQLNFSFSVTHFVTLVQKHMCVRRTTMWVCLIWLIIDMVVMAKENGKWCGWEVRRHEMTMWKSFLHK